MDVESLTAAMSAAHLHDPPENAREAVPFHPPASILQEPNEVPTLLFRVASPYSDGETNETWVRSESSQQGNASSLEDIFSGLNDAKRRTVARTLNRHLRWMPKEDLEDNFISWTSSLLFAFQYIYYLHLSSWRRPSLEEINLYVIDTTRFPPGTFLQDLDLICTFKGFDDHPSDNDLRSLWRLRVQRGYYFGEYLSQGRMKIANKCQIIPARLLFADGRLHRIQPQFKDITTLQRRNYKPGWANEVQLLRQAIWPHSRPQRLTIKELTSRMGAVDEIIDEFDSEWKFPLVIYFMALIGPEIEIAGQEKTADNSFFAHLRSYNDAGGKRKDPWKLNLNAPETMPELKRVEVILHQVHKSTRLKQELDSLAGVEGVLRNLLISTESPGPEGPLSVTDPNPTLAESRNRLLSKLGTIKMLCDQTSARISGTSLYPPLAGGAGELVSP
ncbi:hypothetical protein BDV26DRAFT_282138 [Aspergillus bertholletiae]|uniref:DUF7587 domain-containing protein n=1 Tax=Aspergillus bertholletiae TaxID=1226010 RepID=A0A5N7B6N9_9EURO|nr:hypothetical protein BDV26DRAFT_282138 [Aspergillus bertholletiae]